MTLTYVDSGVLIWAARGVGDLAVRAMRVLDDPGRSFASSVFVELETLPKARHFRRNREVELYESFFGSCVGSPAITGSLTALALEEVTLHGLAGMDALHVVSAWFGGADEIVTAEAPTKPIHRTRRVRVLSLRPTLANGPPR